MSVRLWHRGARLVLVLRRTEGEHASEHRWLALHAVRHPWERLFDAALAIFDLKRGAGLDLRVASDRYWTTIDLRLTEGSLRKRQLIAVALLKAARYQDPPSHG